MAYSYVRYSGNGSTTNYTFSFPTISTDHIKVRVNGSLVTNWSFLSSSTIQFATAPANAAVIEIRRETPKDSAIVNFTDGSVLLERDLDLLATYDLYLAQETKDGLDSSISQTSLGVFDAQSKRIVNVADPINAQDAVTKEWAESGLSSQLSLAAAQATAAAGSATAAAGSATAAATSAGNASTSASNAASSATGASNSATAAAGSATAAANSATAAGTSATNANNSAVAAAASATASAGSASTATTQASNAAASATAAAATYDSFDDRYLGAKAVAPTVDNDGATLLVGAVYWNTVSNKMFSWSGSAWVDVAPRQAVGTQEITATEGQTSFSVSGGYNTNSVYVYLNGILQDASDYTATNGSTVVLASGASAGDTLKVVTFYSPEDSLTIRDAAAASATAASASATAASSSATAAATSATNSGNSATASAGSATSASSSATAAATSASQAATSATSAQNSALSVNDTLNQFANLEYLADWGLITNTPTTITDYGTF